jgi:hypothetical protein
VAMAGLVTFAVAYGLDAETHKPDKPEMSYADSAQLPAAAAYGPVRLATLISMTEARDRHRLRMHPVHTPLVTVHLYFRLRCLPFIFGFPILPRDGTAHSQRPSRRRLHPREESEAQFASSGRRSEHSISRPYLRHAIRQSAFLFPVLMHVAGAKGVLALVVRIGQIGRKR